MRSVIFVMGVSGCGKSTVGADLAAALGWHFQDGDDIHPESNRQKMTAGLPLTDEDRLPWLSAINQLCRNRSHVVVACSALRRSYRDILRQGVDCAFVFLEVSRPVLESRHSARRGHFMPPSLLDSQLATLEQPGDEGDVITIHSDNLSREEVVKAALNQLENQ